MKAFRVKTVDADRGKIQKRYLLMAQNFQSAVNKATNKCSKRQKESVLSVNYAGELER